jgi:dTDP-4-dehydrorhamnose 3,5-epimerase
MTHPKKDLQTVTPDGKNLSPLIDGIKIRYAITHPDARGSLTEVFNPAWGFHDQPMVYLYEFTIRPGTAKGWVVHYQQDDRIFLSRGAVKFVLYDDRPHSPTYKMINEIVVTEQNRALIAYPHGIFHAIANIGIGDALLFNLPTRPYNHADPDKYRLPLNNDVIPYHFEGVTGG